MHHSRKLGLVISSLTCIETYTYPVLCLNESPYVKMKQTNVVFIKLNNTLLDGWTERWMDEESLYFISYLVKLFVASVKKGGHFLFLVLLAFDLNATTLISSRFILANIFRYDSNSTLWHGAIHLHLQHTSLSVHWHLHSVLPSTAFKNKPDSI